MMDDHVTVRLRFTLDPAERDVCPRNMMCMDLVPLQGCSELYGHAIEDGYHHHESQE
jgi:hypothetical protein